MKLEIINPINNKGLGRVYRANDHIESEENYIELGAVVKDDDDNVLKDVVVFVHATDDSQSKILTGTGNVYPIRGKKRIQTPYYPFHYQFKSKGKHTITFQIVDTDIEKRVEIMVGEKKPK